MPRKPKVTQPNPIERKSWGGPAKGPGNGNPRAAPFEKGNTLGANRPSRDAFLRASKAERVATLRGMLFDIAETAEGEAVRKSALDSLWNREEGTPYAGVAPEGEPRPVTVDGGFEDPDAAD